MPTRSSPTPNPHPTGRRLSTRDTSSRREGGSRMPVDAEVAGQRQERGVVEPQRVRRPPRSPAGQLRPRRDQVMLLGNTCASATTLRRRPWPPRRATADVSVGLDGQHEPVQLAVDGQDMHSGHVEQQVGASEGTRTRSRRTYTDQPTNTSRPSLRSTAWSLLILKVWTPSSPHRHARPPQDTAPRLNPTLLWMFVKRSGPGVGR